MAEFIRAIPCGDCHSMVTRSYIEAQAASSATIAPMNRSPRRVTITVPYALYSELLARSDQQGRSLSNLAAFLIEAAISSP
jgi:hypothetical protein